VRTIALDGGEVRVQVIGLQDRRPGAPVVLFEAGASNSLEIWGEVVQRVAAMAPVVAYDRAGLGRSTWDDTNPTPKHVADRFRRVLDLRYRLKVLNEWALASPHGTLVMANNTTHTIPREDPGLIVSAVQRVLGALR